MKTVRILSKLIFNGFRYRLLKLSGKSSGLQAISLEVTHRCICRCCMCNIWQIPYDVPDLPLSEWVDLLSSPGLGDLREIDITGGEPFLRRDLLDLLTWICAAKTKLFPQLRTVAITTNGLLTDRIIKTVGQIVEPMRDQGLELVLACGMDAVGEKHDQIRNHKGAWGKFRATLDELKSLRALYPNLILGIKTTIVPLNVHELDRIARFAQEHELFTIVSPCIITPNRFGNVDLKDELRLSEKDLQAVRHFYEGPSFAWSGHRQAMLQYLKTGKMKKPCSAGFNTVFVHYNGDVCACPLIPKALGNIKHVTLGALLSNRAAVKFRRQVGRFPACEECTEPGLERIAWPFEGFTCLRRLLQMGGRNFDRLAQHMGFDKYL
jgi:MoaA/NifB/PqqE/SkfB family radical SAM enzyme